MCLNVECFGFESSLCGLGLRFEFVSSGVVSVKVDFIGVVVATTSSLIGCWDFSKFGTIFVIKW